MVHLPSSCAFLAQIPEFSRSCIRMKNPERVNEITELFVKEKWENFQVFADFDQTLTKSHCDGKKCSNSFGIINWSPDMPQSYQKDQKELWDEFLPKIMNGAGGMCNKNNVPEIYEWFARQMRLYSNYNVNKNNFPAMVRQSHTSMRDGSDCLMKTLDEHQIPFTLLSAGLGDIQLEMMKQKSAMLSNMHMVANYFEYDDVGNVTGLVGGKESIIHIFNKCDRAAKMAKSCPEIQNRKNVLVLGDNVADGNMADSLELPRSLLKIGYLNERVEERLAAYEDAFDVVVIDDQSLDLVNAIVSKILGL